MSIDNFLKKINDHGGFATSNNYDIQFNLTTQVAAAVKPFYDAEVVKLLCDEAQLPNVGAVTGSIAGRYLGEGQVNYATMRQYSTFQLGWTLTADLMPLKFIQTWNDFIFGENHTGSFAGTSPESLRSTKTRLQKNRSTRLAYPDEYRCEIRITKAEIGPEKTQERAPITYIMENAWPSEIDAVPLSYGSTQLVKFTAQFQYQRHHVIMNDTNSQQFKRVKTLYSNGKYVGINAPRNGGSILAPGPGGDF